MDYIVTIVSALAVSLIGLFVEYFFAIPARKNQEAKRRKTQEAVTNAQVSLVRDLLSDLPEPARERYINYLIKSQRPDGSFTEAPINIGNVNLPEIDEKVNLALSPLKSRLEEIEKRFPAESTIDKIANVNDAILATKIDQLTADIKRLDEKLLGKWDVAVVVLEVIATVGTLAGVIIAAIQFFVTKATP